MARTPKAGRNDLCPCGSGKKHKRCCANKSASGNRVMLALVIAVVVGAVLAGIASFTGSSNATVPGQVWSSEHGHYH
jgi:hypothetical protein